MLKPSFYKAKDIKLCTFDIETDYPDNPEDILIIGFYNGKKYFEFDNMDAFLGEALKAKYFNHYIYAHNGGRFDFKFLLETLHKYDYDFIDILDVNGSILNIRVPFQHYKNKNGTVLPKYNINFTDSLMLLKDSLHKITHSFKVPHRKKELNFFKKDEPKYIDKFKNWDLFTEYLQYDTIGLYEAIRHFETIIHKYDGNIKLTIASTSMSIFKNRFLDTVIYPVNKTIKVQGDKLLNIEDEIRNNYVGGRTEIFKRYGEKLYYYDVNSLYPFVMYDNPYPVSNPIYVTGEQISKNDIGFFQCDIKYNECLHGIPLLPKKITNGGFNKLVYPLGSWSGLYDSEMIKYAINEGYEIDIKYGFIFDHEYIFKDFITEFYKLRKENPSYNLIFKYMLNSLYGKWAQKRENTQIVKIKNPEFFKKYKEVKSYIDELDLFEVTSEINSPHIIPSISNRVTQLSQLELYKWFKKADFDIYNCDTDSLVTSKKLPHSAELGDIKLEYTIDEAIFLFPKFYCFNGYDVKNKENVTIKTMKGYNKGRDNIEYSDFEKALFNKDYKPFDLEYTDLWGFKESLRRKNKFLNYGLKKKSIKSDYNKRIVLKDNINTLPLTINNDTVI